MKKVENQIMKHILLLILIIGSSTTIKHKMKTVTSFGYQLVE